MLYAFNIQQNVAKGDYGRRFHVDQTESSY